MNINIEQLKEIWQMQKDLDKRIHDENGLDPDDTINKRKIALIVELGELMQELPSTFKYWKKGAIDNRDKALEEFVDCLHFALSLTCYDDINSIDVGTIHEYYHESAIFWLLSELVNDGDYTVEFILSIANSLGFTWEEIYQGYLAKNKINHQRQANGY